MPASTEPGVSYSISLGMVYVFNLIVGTGALALPKAFKGSGFILGPIMLALSAFVSYIGATFVMESMSVANSVLRRRQKSRKSSVSSHGSASSEDEPLLEQPPTDQKVELSEMGSLFIGSWGFILVQVCMVIYLFGDLAVYSTVVPKSLIQYKGNSCRTINATELVDLDPCFESWDISRMNFYRILVAAFVGLVGPFVFLGITKTKYLQLFTSLTRWLAFFLLLTLATRRIASGEGTGHPKAAQLNGFSHLFGVATYAFMCHHSLPSLVTPIRQKKHLFIFALVVYLGILCFYLALSLTGVFAFDNLKDVYTLNFLQPCPKSPTSVGEWALAISDYFLALFPVFSLSTNFPIVGITLRNNILAILHFHRARKAKVLEGDVNAGYAALEEEAPDRSTPSSAVEDLTHTQVQVPGDPTPRLGWARAESWAVAATVVLLPSLISLATDDVEILASVTGSYAGVGVQFVVPSLLAIFARRVSVGRGLRSPFGWSFWPWLLLAWAALTLILVSVNLAL